MQIQSTKDETCTREPSNTRVASSRDSSDEPSAWNLGLCGS